MTGVVESLSAAGSSAPVQRVRNYYLTDRAASPRPRDFLTAMKRTDGAVYVRWDGPPGDCFVRWADPGWECAKHDRFRGRATVESVESDRVRTWLGQSRPELVAREDAPRAFDVSPSPESPASDETATTADGTPVVADGGRTDTPAGDDWSVPGASHAGIRLVYDRTDLLADAELDRADADALADALPAGRDEVVFRLPLVLAEESVLDSVSGSDCVFVAESVPDRETDAAYYVRQGRKGCWVPKAETQVYELAGDCLGAESDERPESV